LNEYFNKYASDAVRKEISKVLKDKSETPSSRGAGSTMESGT
jgi:hypothetical protein